MITLKNNTKTNDARLDRVLQFDERSREFPVRKLVDLEKPLRAYTWRCLKALDQGPDGACVGFGVTHELIARPAEVQGLDAKYAKENIYWEAQKIDPWGGGSYPGAGYYYQGTSVLAGVKVAHKLGWMDSYYWAFSFHEFAQTIGRHGPAVIGINWYEGMFQPDSNNFIHPTGYVAGGHCVLVNSISVSNERFTIHNSWGPHWGDNGEVYISFSDMERLLKEDGEACFFKHRHHKPQPE